MTEEEKRPEETEDSKAQEPQAEETPQEVPEQEAAQEAPAQEAAQEAPVQETAQEKAPESKPKAEKKERGKQRFEGKGGKNKTQGKAAQTEPEVPETLEKVISINRITKVTKGGKKLSFSALVVVGNMKGEVGYSLSKAAEVAIAIRKAMAEAKKNMIRVPMRGTTIPHEIIGQCSGSRVLLKPASDGTGVIASGPVRAVCDGAGIHNILTKCHRSNNPINVVKATIDGFSRLKTVEP